MTVKVLCQFIDEKDDHYGYVVRRSFDWMPAQGDWLEFSSTGGVRRGRVVGDRTYDSDGCPIIDVVLGGFESPSQPDATLIGIMWQPPAERLNRQSGRTRRPLHT